MKNLRIILGSTAAMLTAVPSAFAGAVKVYSSSMLVLIFVGFLALVIAMQLIPAIMTLIGALKGINKVENVQETKAEAGK